VYKYLTDGIKTTEPGSLDKRQRAQIAREEIPFEQKKNLFSLWGWSNTGTGCLERLWSLHPWRYIQKQSGHMVLGIWLLFTLLGAGELDWTISRAAFPL